MALTAEQKKRLDKLDFGTGGGFSDFMADRQKLAAAGSKFLFVGLGGKGCKTVASIKTEVYKKIKCPEGKTRPDNFEYLAIDTDSDTLDNLCMAKFGEVGLSSSPANKETFHLFNSNAAEQLKPENRYKLPDYIKSWLNPKMNQKLQGAGAGGIRQAGRYMLFCNEIFSGLESILTEKLSNLHSQISNTDKEKLIVYIFAGVSGGTGSGTIIDIPYIIREICEQNDWNVKIYGYIFLPDTYSFQNAGKKLHLKYNAYAALKEIDTLMNIEHMNGTACFKARYTPTFKVDSKEGIFNSCVLVSGKQEIKGKVIDSDNFTRRVVTDNILNLVADNITSNEFLANSFLDNDISEIRNAVKPIENIPKNAFYQYIVIGTGAIILPMEQILTYIAHGTFEMLQEGWDKHATQNDVEGLLNQIHMRPEDQAVAIIGKSKLPLMKYSKGIGGSKVSKKDVINDVLYNNIKATWMAQNTPLYKEWEEAKNHNLESIISSLNDDYRRKFKDKDCGIYFLKELLSCRIVDGVGFNGILERLENGYLTSIQGLIGGQEEIQTRADERMRDIKVELDSLLCVGPLENNKIEEYRSLCVQKFVADNMIYMYDTIVRDCLKQIIKWLEARLEELQTYIDIFAYMTEVVKRNYDMVMNDTMPTAEYAGKLLEFSKKGSDSATDNIINYLDGMLKAKTPEGLVTALEDSIQKNEKNWIAREKDKEDNFNPMKIFVSFLENQYTSLSNLTLQAFLNIKYGAQNIDKGLQEICSELKSKSQITFKTKPILDLGFLASRKYVVIPNTTQSIKAALSKEASQNTADSVDSPDMNSIYWYNLAVGVSLYALVDIEKYEELYEQNLMSGIHIQETADDNWQDLPALTNQSQWSIPDFNPRERAFASQVEADVDTYIKCGLIAKNANFYEAYCLAEDDSKYADDKVIDWCRNVYLENPIINEDGLIENGKEYFDRMKAENSFIKYQVDIPSVFMDLTDDNIYQLIRMNIFLYRKLQKTYKVYEECRKIIDENSKVRTEEIRRKKNMKRLYDYWRTGIIQMNEDNILLEKKNHQQEEVLYFNDYSKWDKQFFVYYAVQNLADKFPEEELSELDDFRNELTGDHSKESQDKYRKLSDEFMNECRKASDLLKKLDTKKTFEKMGQQNMVAILTEFYEELLFMEV